MRLKAKLRFIVTVAGVSLIAMATSPAHSSSSRDAIADIKLEALQRSQVFDVASYIADVFGARLAGSPSLDRAGLWTVSKLREWGISSAAREEVLDLRGMSEWWSNDKLYLAVVSPERFQIAGIPVAWRPGTNGRVSGPVLVIRENTASDLSKYAGKLRGAFVLTGNPPNVEAFFNPQARRRSSDELEQLQAQVLPPPTNNQGAPGRQGAPPSPPFDRNAFFRAEGVAALLTTDSIGHGISFASGFPNAAVPITQVSIPAEDYGRIVRLIQRGLPVTLEAEIQNTFHPNPKLFNVVAELRGSQTPNEFVMIGAHLDSWHAGSGATDNAAGVATVMEAMRILKTLGVPLRRSIRLGLWTAEEQTYAGSIAYVATHLTEATCRPWTPEEAAQPNPANDDTFARFAAANRTGRAGRGNGRLELKPTGDYVNLSAYFNVDGAGAIRGLFLQRNEAVRPIFQGWLNQLVDLGFTHLSINSQTNQDHISFDAFGLPAFTFIMDGLEERLSHHTNLDTTERLQPDDLKKNAAIVAVIAYLVANHEVKLPRKPLTGC